MVNIKLMSLLTLFSDKLYLGIFPNNVSLFAILYITANGLFVKTLNYIYIQLKYNHLLTFLMLKVVYNINIVQLHSIEVINKFLKI